MFNRLDPPRERPSAAGAFIIFERRGISTPVSNSKRGRFFWEIIQNNLTLHSFVPARGQSPIAVTACCNQKRTIARGGIVIRENVLFQSKNLHIPFFNPASHH